MLKNYFKIAFRNLKKHKLYSVINIMSLTIGITCCILIALYIRHELSYDSYFKNAKDIYRLTVEQHSGKGISTDAETPMPLGEAL